MEFRHDIEYRKFSDEQIVSFAGAAALEYADEWHWRDDLDDTARDFIIDHYTQTWHSPSSVIKKLNAINKNPESFFKLIDDYGIDTLPMPLSSALCHGTGWAIDQLRYATNEKELFLVGVEREIQFLCGLIEKRKAIGVRGNKGNPALRDFVNRIAFIFQDAFLQRANAGLSIPYGGGVPTGPFLRYAKTVSQCMEQNLSEAVRSTDTKLPSLLKRLAMSGDTSISQHLLRSEYYALVTGEGRI